MSKHSSSLIDGYGSTPIRNSVVIIEGERIKAVGQVGTPAIPPGAEVISTDGMSVLQHKTLSRLAKRLFKKNVIRVVL